MNRKINKTIAKELKDYQFNSCLISPLESSAVDSYYQKGFKDEAGNKRYYLDVKHYKYENPVNHCEINGYEIECQLYLKDSHNAFNLNFLEGTTIKEAIEFIDFLFESGKLDNYEDAEVL